MACSFAGIRLAVLPADYQEWVENWHSLTDFADAATWPFGEVGLASLPLPVDPSDGPPEVGVLRWPTGLSRYSSFHALIDSVGLADIRTALGTGAGPANLVLTDGTGNTRTFSLYFVGARPLAQITGQTQAYLLTLADRRYWLRERTGSVTSVSTWSTLLSGMASSLGITLTPDTIDADYGAPTSLWVFNERPLALAVDAACNRIGHRVVANLDGTFSTVRATTAEAASDALAASFSKTAGGLLVLGDLNRPVPASIKTAFRNDSSATAYTVTNTLASLALADYGAATGVAGQQQTIFGETIYTGANAAALASYAAQAATDWYQWQLADVDVTLPGIAQWNPTGWEDRIEWKYFHDRILTRIVRGPFQVLPSGFFPVEMTSGDVPIGCGLVETAGEIVIDFAGIVGDGLQVNEEGDCPVIEVNYGCGLELGVGGELQVDGGTLAGAGLSGTGTCTLTVNTGCGLTIASDAVALNLTAVVFDGLYWNNSICALGVNFGCGLTLGVGDTLVVDNVDLAGVRIDTSMVPDGVCGVAFDKVINSTVAVTYVTDVSISYNAEGTFTLNKTRQTITDRYNLSGVIVDRVYGTPVDSTYTVDVCELTECCPCETTGVQDYTSAAGDFTFTALCTGLHTIECWGGGGDAQYNVSRTSGSGGAGGGAYARSELCLEDGVEYAVHVGNHGLPGEDSTFGVTLVVAKGGQTNDNLTGGQGGSAAASTGQVKYSGGDGGPGTTFPDGTGGGGGGAAGTAGDGADGGTPLHGNGGPPEGPTVGDGGDGGLIGFSGTNAQLYGGGGGGSGGGASTIGGEGTRGRVRITW